MTLETEAKIRDFFSRPVNQGKDCAYPSHQIVIAGAFIDCLWDVRLMKYRMTVSSELNDVLGYGVTEHAYEVPGLAVKMFADYEAFVALQAVANLE